MKRVIIFAVILYWLCLSYVEAFEPMQYKIKPNDQVMITLLSMVINDLEMCRASLRPRLDGYFDNVLAIGHLNNAKSALRRADLDPSYIPLVSEILDRIDKIRFYLLINDLDNVNMRLIQLITVLRAILTAEAGTTQSGTYSSHTQQSSHTGQTSYYPSKPIVILNYPSQYPPVVIIPNFPGFPTIGFGGGQELPNNGGVPNLPVIPN